MFFPSLLRDEESKIEKTDSGGKREQITVQKAGRLATLTLRRTGQLPNDLPFLKTSQIPALFSLALPIFFFFREEVKKERSFDKKEE